MLRQILSQKTAPSESIDSSKWWDHVIHTIVYDSYVDLQTDQTTCGFVCECVYIIYIIHIILHNIIYIYTRTYWYVHAGVECTDYVYHIMVQRFEPSVRDHQ